VSRRAVLFLTLLAMVLAGCTGVPSSSAPETVEPVQVGDGSAAQALPPVGAGPRDMVGLFLEANATESLKHASARAFLTRTARGRWSDQTATIVDNESIGTYDANKHTLTVTGQVEGTLNGQGIYTPSLQTGNGGARVPFVYGVVKEKGEYRIDPKRNGLLITGDQFKDAYQEHVLYFYDLAERYLVPDVRWSSLVPTERQPIAAWLTGLLVGGPRPELQNVVSTNTLPAQANARGVTVKLGSPTEVEIPGSSQLDGGVRDRLAAQVAETLDQPLSGGSVSITDGGTPVAIPRTGGTTFSASSFPEATGPPQPPSNVYYLADGKVIDEDGKALSGPLGDGTNVLNSIAVARRTEIGGLAVAAVQGSGADARLLVGTQAGGVRQTTVHGRLSRPAWAPGRAEIWIGQDSTVKLVTTNGRTWRVHSVAIPPTAGGGRIVALRLSPDGSRIAIVATGAEPGSAQLYVGSVVRGAGQVYVSSLLPISPRSVVITDVGWNSPLKLFAIGYLAASQDARIYSAGVDGSFWTSTGIGTLPAPPDSLTVTTYGLWVSSDGNVWMQSGSSWVSPGASGQTPGAKPVYLG
jgi:hypothetical protein